MTKKMLQVLALSFSLTIFAVAQSRTETAGNSDTEPQVVHADADPKNLKSDLERMRIVLEQMQRNVAFVSSGDTPLKHQFQLEIEMWRLLIGDMETKVGVSEDSDFSQNSKVTKRAASDPTFLNRCLPPLIQTARPALR